MASSLKQMGDYPFKQQIIKAKRKGMKFAAYEEFTHD
jgi:hypothetical protein